MLLTLLFILYVIVVAMQNAPDDLPLPMRKKITRIFMLVLFVIVSVRQSCLV